MVKLSRLFNLNMSHKWYNEGNESKKDELLNNLMCLYKEWSESSTDDLLSLPIYDVTNVNDVVLCLQNGIDLVELAKVKENYLYLHLTPFFTLIEGLGNKGKEISQFDNKNEIVDFILNGDCEDEIYEWLVCHNDNETFSYFYDNFFHPIINNN